MYSSDGRILQEYSLFLQELYPGAAGPMSRVWFLLGFVFCKLTLLYFTLTFYCVLQNAYYFRFSFPRVYDVPRVLIVDARSFQALAAILDYVTHLASMSSCFIVKISKVRGYDHVCSRWSAKKKKKTRKYQLYSNKTRRTHFSNL